MLASWMRVAKAVPLSGLIGLAAAAFEAYEQAERATFEDSEFTFKMDPTKPAG
jgi:hypothetical protein